MYIMGGNLQCTLHKLALNVLNKSVSNLKRAFLKKQFLLLKKNVLLDILFFPPLVFESSI